MADRPFQTLDDIYADRERQLAESDRRNRHVWLYVAGGVALGAALVLAGIALGVMLIQWLR